MREPRLVDQGQDSKYMKYINVLFWVDLCLQIDLLLVHDISQMVTQGCSSGNVQEFKLHVGNTSLESEALFDLVTGEERVRKNIAPTQSGPSKYGCNVYRFV